MSCGIGRRRGSDLALLWQRLVATAPIGPLAWEPPYAMDAALKKKKKKLLLILNVLFIIYVGVPWWPRG